ncbi:3'-5' exonuclease [Sphingomonas sp. Leaf230]|uniref:3'-5' exonuclease n=1 Tax=Sphingomonas sp. Leaf230 TaxID=1735694 RepID=UPI0009EC9BCC|nr:3'-5' exonuclease [Sphingomonas sp. Leaf230]
MKTQSEIGDEAIKDSASALVLRPLKLEAGPTGDGVGRGKFVGVAVDVETTSLNSKTGRIIEFACRRFRYDGAGVITDIDEAFEWREDPGEPLTPEVAMLTGLTDDDLVGCEIDDDTVKRLLCSASFVVAHNSIFDRTWVEDRFPEVRDLPWTCSMSQIDWKARGFDGKVLGYLLMQSGFFHSGHRASADVDALIQLLRHRRDDDCTGLAELIERGSQTSWLIRARGADFGVKHLLKDRGYRWSGDDKVWWREVDDARLVEEQFWLASYVYAVEANPTALGPVIKRITPRERFR